MNIPNDATLRQIEAAMPRVSTWLSANAGSGKTRVLTDRVARLLLEGVDPQNVLCLTYTKAAATEMQNRLFRRLGSWSMLPDHDLAADLTEMGVDGAITPERLSDARRLFARAIETPGGLKIQTIHSFCAGLLRRFPLEAGVSPAFSEMEDRESELLRAEVLDEIATGPDGRAIDDVARYLTDDRLASFTKSVVSQRDRFAVPLDEIGLNRLFETTLGDDLAKLVGRCFEASDLKTISDLIHVAQTGSANDVKVAAKLSALGSLDLAGLLICEDVFLTGSGAKEPFSAKASVLTKGLSTANPELTEASFDLAVRVGAARDTRLALAARDKTAALYRFAKAFLPAYDVRKLSRGVLDFDDLIRKARALLTDRDVAQWVLFKLDGGIDHILVDEAQDTSPAQWDVIRALASEFSAGVGARSDHNRTIFVVGDKKQSIYSFQGADPDGFDRMQDHFGEQLSNIGEHLNPLELEYSFRSSQAILRVVDQTFEGERRKGLSKTVHHIAFKSAMPGRVDLWAPVDKTDKAAEGEWFDPVDLKSELHQDVLLGRAIADEIKRMIAQEILPVEDKKTGLYGARAIRPGDFLILVQGRQRAIFSEVIRACKSRGLDIAGADVLKLNAELAVKDILATLRFLALAEDDLSLAAALKSPLFGWSEQQLFTLAHGRRRGEFLWQRLRDAAKDHPATMTIIEDLRRTSDFLRPYDLISRILVRHDGRRQLIARLGPEAADGIDALLSQALAYERSGVPSLTGFLGWMEDDELKVKRQPDGAGDRIRVMTVHGAKGLESPIVILPDTAKRDITLKDDILPLQDRAAWRTNKDDTPGALQAARDLWQEKQEEERRRLLYVAMTRAESWLIVAASGELGKSPDDSWYGMIQDGLCQTGAEKIPTPTGPGLRYQTSTWAETVTVSPDSLPKTVPVPLALSPLPATPMRPAVLTPSDLGGTKVMPGESDESESEVALARGRMIHLLLEHLPKVDENQRHSLGQRLLEDSSDLSLIGDAGPLLKRALSLVNDAALGQVFSPGSLAEVAVTATLAELGGQRLRGAIDRLIIGPQAVLAVDYKSNRLTPKDPAETPEGILRQMGAYAAMLYQIYPDHTVQTAILWTETGKLMLLPDPLTKAALGRVTLP